MSRTIPLIGFMILVLGGGFLVGFWAMPGEWYEQLNKPFFNPPNWIFGPVWTVLYLLIAFAGWRLWMNNATDPAMAVWWVQLALNFLWPLVFFSAERINLALIVILVLLLAIITLIGLTIRRDRLVALLMMPYALWVAFASLLNAAIVILN
ncbi:MAG: tryptophan-rich sensory protein [Alphaproteobacteria bacterium]|nr:tryptophan-rich sensory protein [Alphaproteobacteria bacterium]